MKIALRICATLVVLLVVGWMAQHIVLEHAHIRTAGYGPQTILAGYTAGLFAGGASAVIVLIALFMLDSKPPQE